MRLIASLTIPALASCALALGACANNAPKKPTAASDKSRDTAFYDNCYDAYSRSYSRPVGCPEYDSGYYRTRRGNAAPAIDADPLTLPSLPGREGLGGVLGR